MKRTSLPSFLPQPQALLSAVLAFAFLHLFGLFLALVVPRLLDLWEESPRLAALGFLAVWTSPVVAGAVIHRACGGILDGFDPRRGASRGILPGALSWWAGLVMWLVLCFASLVASLLAFAVAPPDGATLARVALDGVTAKSAIVSFYSFVWVGVAAAVYQLEYVVKKAIAERAE